MNPQQIRQDAIDAHEAASIAHQRLLSAIEELESLAEMAGTVPEVQDVATRLPVNQNVYTACDEQPGRSFVHKMPKGKDPLSYAAWLKRYASADYEFAVSFDGVIVVRRSTTARELPRFPALPTIAEEIEAEKARQLRRAVGLEL